MDISDYVSGKNIGGINNAVETNLGSFSASSITIIGNDIAWWDANIFSYANQLEVKIEYVLNGLVADTIPIFSGWIEKRKSEFKVTRTVTTNKLQFTVWSYINYASEVSAMSLLAQYIDDDVDGSGTDGLILPHINNLFITNANVTSFALKTGVHIITYKSVTTPVKQAKLDDGEWVTLVFDDYVDLINADLDQKVTVYARAGLPSYDETIEEIIVDTFHDAIPKNWHFGTSAKYLLEKLFTKAGITTLNFDALEYNTASGAKKLSFIGLPPDDGTFLKDKRSLASDGTNLWFGIGNKIYLRDANGNYAQPDNAVLPSGYKINRMEYAPTNGHLWIYCGITGNFSLYRYTPSSDTLSAETVINSGVQGWQVYEIGGEYSVLFIDGYNQRRLDGNSLVVTLLFGALTDSYSRTIKKGTNKFLQVASGAIFSATFGTAWTDDGSLGLTIPNYTQYGYSQTEDRVYFDTIDKIQSHTLSSSTVTDVYNKSALLGAIADNFYYDAIDEAVFCFINGYNVTNERRLIALYSNSYTIIHNNIAGHLTWSIITSHNGVLYGLDFLGRLWKYSTTIALYVEMAKFENINVRSAIENICNSFNLLYSVSSTKSARVQRRSDSDGNLITSGNSITLTADTAKDITEESAYSVVADMVEVDNGRRKVCYDGTVFDAIAFADEIVLPISSGLIPDEIIEDIAYNAYQFFSVPKKLYSIPSPVMNWQAESLDEAVLSYTGNIVVSNTGLIIGDAIDKIGKMEFKVLVNA
jgi:hypothetical protein